MKFGRFALTALVGFLFVGCQMKPTRVQVTETREFNIVVDKSRKPIEITDKTVILDARKAFDYGLNRVANSYNVTWESLAESAETGEVMRDKRRLAQRLSLYGLTPFTPIVIVGYGLTGEAEEGRLAWTLLYLGFRDVQTANMEIFRNSWTQTPTPAAKNTTPVDINGDARMMVSKEEFKRLSADIKGRAQSRTYILDVRDEREYFNKSPGSKARPDIGALNIPWKEFFGTDGRPNLKLRERLKGLNIGMNDRIVVVSTRGVRSSAAAYSLISLGFTRVENFLPGWRAL